ncbi:hypothetical protein BKA66DRAFT_386878, partial [Pyrenochaeta sp. MPI-SDFR-AT-0127]
VLLMIDLDAPLDSARVSHLHWLVTDVTVVNSDSNPSPESVAPLNIPNVQVPCIQPEPPVGDVAHTYQFYLFSPQPSGFSIPARYSNLSENRAPFSLSHFIKDTGLEQTPIVARSNFRVQNLADHPTMTFPPPSASET